MITPRLYPLLCTLLIIITHLFTPTADAQVPRVIFDSDMSSDWDDVGAFATLQALADLGECQIIGCMVSSTNGGTPLCMDAINTYYGRPDIPIGVRPDITVGIGGYPGTIATEFPHDLQSSQNCPHAASLYRQLLAAQPDNSVTIITAGYLTNLKALLQSGPDQYSSLSGSALVAQKVKLWSCMGGAYPSGNEFNFRSSGDDSAYVVVNNWPTRVTYAGFAIGSPIVTGGRLLQTPTSNPIRRVWELKGGAPHPSYDQTAVYHAIRAAEGLFGVETVGHNNTDTAGGNWWSTETDPSGNLDQGYLLEKMRYPVQIAIDTLMMAPPGSAASSLPSQPTNVRGTVVSSSRIDLQWADNAHNESGFVIERQVNGVYSQIATVGANVTTYSSTGLASTANCNYRVKAYNANGSSDYYYLSVYSGWTEINFTTPANLPLYTYHQFSHLRWGRGANDKPDHVTLNNDSSHGATVTVTAEVASLGSSGTSYIYFFYQDQSNWYRLAVDSTVSKFEKRIAGTTTQIGASAAGISMAGGTPMQTWRVEVVPSGTLKFTAGGTTILNVSQALSLTTGRIGLGGSGRAPLWQNFSFDAAGSGGGGVPVAPTGLTATAGNTQITLNWSASSGATSYNVYRGTTAGGESTTPVATGITGTSYTNTGLTNGTAYFYKVKAVNASGTSGYSNEASATPVAGSVPAAPTGLAASPGNTQISLSWTASSGATSYNVYRGTTAGGQSTTAIATGITGTSYTNTGLTNGTTYYYKIKAVNASGTSGYSNEASATPTAGGGSGAFVNPSFETPSLATYSYNPAGSSWTFTNNAGIQHNGSAYSGTTAVAPDGVQTAFVQSISGTLGTMSQTLTLSAGTYTISFQGARRSGTIQPVRVSVDGTAVGTYTPASNSFALITTAGFTVTAGNHNITFAATDSVGDKTTFIDVVSIGGGGSQVPAAPTGLTATSGNSQISLSWTASSGATSYNVYRGTTAGGESTNPIATGVTSTSYVNTGLTNGTAYFYMVKAVNASGTSGYSNEASATPSSGGTPAVFANAGFENPAISGHSYNPAGSSWTFTNNAGIQHNGSAYSGTTAVAPEGVQTAFVQSISGTLGTMSQTVNFPAGTYRISFQAARRSGSIQPVRVSVDGTTVGTYTPASNSFALITTATFNVTAGNHTVTFAATDSVGDKTTFIDVVAIGP